MLSLQLVIAHSGRRDPLTAIRAEITNVLIRGSMDTFMFHGQARRCLITVPTLLLAVWGNVQILWFVY
jgi:hypothetical protein